MVKNRSKEAERVPERKKSVCSFIQRTVLVKDDNLEINLFHDREMNLL